MEKKYRKMMDESEENAKILRGNDWTRGHDLHRTHKGMLKQELNMPPHNKYKARELFNFETLEKLLADFKNQQRQTTNYKFATLSTIRRYGPRKRTWEILKVSREAGDPP
jgi:hypothetical protein